MRCTHQNKYMLLGRFCLNSQWPCPQKNEKSCNRNAREHVYFRVNHLKGRLCTETLFQILISELKPGNYIKGQTAEKERRGKGRRGEREGQGRERQKVKEGGGKGENH